MDTITAILATVVEIAILFEIARRIGVPYPTLFVLGGLGLAFVPGLPTITLEINDQTLREIERELDLE